MIEINQTISISEDELSEKFIRSSGPGGQNVNKVATAVQLRFDAVNSPSLPEGVRARLIALAGSRITSEGEIIIEADRFRTREQNRADAVERLVELIRKAAVKPKPRRKTKVSKAAKKRRVDAKVRRGDIKRSRSKVTRYD
ncbi:MAG: aminoacyl-tRNA hydrolase [Deltaproteobacteria bacterium]|nr:MAG: aminoacyl-tRNA hydrolase [Deltaproteobacteria bacterium]